MNLSVVQIEKLADLCMDLAKGLFLAALVGPAINSQLEFIDSLRTLLSGCFFTLLALYTLRLKEV